MPPPEIVIRPATLEDAAAIAEIYNEAIRGATATFDTEPKTERDRRQWLQSHDRRHPVIVAQWNGRVVGWAALSPWSDRCAYSQTAESSFYVAQRHRGLGIGRLLKQSLVAEAKKAGLHTVIARVAEGNQASIHLNESVGFTHVGTMRQVGFKFGRRLDVYIMQLILDEDVGECEQAGELTTVADSSKTVGQFFDGLRQDYTAAIERCFPRYREMLWALLDYLPPRQPFQSILELGSGTGNLSVLLAQKFPAARLHLVDLSGESLQECRSRLGADPRFIFEGNDFRQLAFQDGVFDLVISSIALHHLTSNQKQALFAKVHAWLTPDGVFSYADQCAGATQDLYARHIANWKEQSLKAGSSADEWEMWMDHQREHDHHDSVTDQFAWLAKAGFTVIDCPWRYLLWTVVQARRNPHPSKRR